MVSEKQKAILTKNGYTETQIGQMNYQLISEVIGKILARPKDVQANQAPYNKEIPAVQVEKPVFVPKKQGFDATSSYTRQSVDIYLALRTMMHEELGVKHPELIKDEVIMALAINLVNQALKEFE